MKDIKHIRRDFHLATWVMPQGSDLGVPWGVGGSNFFYTKFNQIWCVNYSHEWHMHVQFWRSKILFSGHGQIGHVAFQIKGDDHKGAVDQDTLKNFNLRSN